MKPYFLYFETEVKHLDPLLERRVLAHTEDLMLVELILKSGALIKAHQHVHAQMTYIVEGVFEYDIDGDLKIVKKGDSLSIESNIIHSALCLEEGKLLDVFMPSRKEFLT